jgi:hypothetical protein
VAVCVRACVREERISLSLSNDLGNDMRSLSSVCVRVYTTANGVAQGYPECWVLPSNVPAKNLEAARKGFTRSKRIFWRDLLNLKKGT